jgi:hypothetical protein
VLSSNRKDLIEGTPDWYGINRDRKSSYAIEERRGLCQLNALFSLGTQHCIPDLKKPHGRYNECRPLRQQIENCLGQRSSFIIETPGDSNGRVQD